MTQLRTVLALTFLGFLGNSADAQTTSFTYQGRLTDAALPANGSYSIRFDLFAAPTGGSALATQTIPNVAVTNGVFTVSLDFAPTLFDGNSRYLEITVGSTTLAPRQQITSAPYAIKATRATTADDSSALGGLAADEYVVMDDPRLSDARNPLAGSGHYIRNGTTPQSGDFSLSGNGALGGALYAENVFANAGTFRSPLVTGRAVYAENTYPGTNSGFGVYGRSVNAVGHGHGGHFEGGERGVTGFADGRGSSSIAYGVFGTANGTAGSRVGVYGSAGGSGVTTAYGIFGSAGGASTNWAGYFEGNVRVLGNTGIGIDPDAGLAGTFGNTLTVSGTVRAGANNANACDLQLADDVCFFDEQNGGLSVRNFSGTSYAPIKASAFNVASSIALKKDITLLGVSDFDAMLGQILELPVFTYRYENESDSAALHTGLIAERSPASLLSGDGKAVDLYGLASTNAGATKALAARLAAVTAENAALRLRLERLEQLLLRPSAQARNRKP